MSSNKLRNWVKMRPHEVYRRHLQFGVKQELIEMAYRCNKSQEEQWFLVMSDTNSSS